MTNEDNLTNIKICLNLAVDYRLLFL